MPKKIRGTSGKPSASPKAKKTKRPMLQPRPVTPLAPRPYGTPVISPTATKSSPAFTRGRQAVLGDYSYVGPELRRIGIFAATIFIIMAALAVLLR